MFQNEDLKEHLETSSSIKVQSAVIAEWNMNFAENIAKLGNYRFRPTESPLSSKYATITNKYEKFDDANFYT
jgi:hypothetical protein